MKEREIRWTKCSRKRKRGRFPLARSGASLIYPTVASGINANKQKLGFARLLVLKWQYCATNESFLKMCSGHLNLSCLHSKKGSWLLFKYVKVFDQLDCRKISP